MPGTDNRSFSGGKINNPISNITEGDVFKQSLHHSDPSDKYQLTTEFLF